MQLYCHITNSSKRQKQFDYRYAHTLIHTEYWAQIGDYRYCTRKHSTDRVQTEYREITVELKSKTTPLTVGEREASDCHCWLSQRCLAVEQPDNCSTALTEPVTVVNYS